MCTVAEVWRYPVKSMRGERVQVSGVEPEGLRGDRGYALIDAQTGKVASGSWKPRRWADLVGWSASYLAEPGSGSDPLPQVRIVGPSGDELESSHPDIDSHLSAALGRDVRLATVATVGTETPAVMHGRDSLPGTFQDIDAVHIVTAATLARLAELSPGSIFDARRFRPNLVIGTGDEPGFVEDQWLGRTLIIDGEVSLRITQRCPRCVMTTHPQGDLPKDAQVLRTAARGNEGNVGVYAEVLRSGLVRAGAQVVLSA